MSMCAHIRIDAESNSCHLALGGGKLIDDIEFGKTLNIEAEDVLVKTEVNLPVALAYTGIYNAVSRESCLAGSLYLSAADTIGT